MLRVICIPFADSTSEADVVIVQVILYGAVSLARTTCALVPKRFNQTRVSYAMVLQTYRVLEAVMPGYGATPDFCGFSGLPSYYPPARIS